MKYLNQLEYAHIPYRTHANIDTVPEEKKIKNVRKSGCGLCAVCMMLDLLTTESLSLEECVKISEACGANHGVGTDMTVLAPVIAARYGLVYTRTSDPAEAVAHLQKGGQVIAHMGIPEGKTVGLFTKGGHYINLISCDGERFCVLDPSYTPDKFEIPERAGRVDTSHVPYLYCNVATLDAETKPKRTKYHLFARKQDGM